MNVLSAIRAEIGIEKSIRRHSSVTVKWIKTGGRLAGMLSGETVPVPAFPKVRNIERRAHRTSNLGSFGLHEQYGATGKNMNPDDVRCSQRIGRLYRWLTVTFKPEVIIEIGTAFGTSGMYWLAGLEENGSGELATFEMNEAWRQVAVQNLSRIGTRYKSVAGPFEDHWEEALGGRRIGIALIDGIHTREWVMPQFERILSRLAPGGLIGFDDIDFSDEMKEVWASLAEHSSAVAAVEVNSHLGILEMKG